MDQVEELFSFLGDDREEVRQLAASSVLSITSTPSLLPHFKSNECQVIKTLMKMRNENAKTAHDAISCLINLSHDPQVLVALDDEAFLLDIILSIILPKSLLADLFCMLLNNMTKNLSTVQKILSTVTKSNYVDNLLEVFVRGQRHNTNASFHFLACVFANLSATSEGALFLLGNSTVDNTSRLSRLLSCTEHENVIRRGGVISTLKNCSFYPESHPMILNNDLFLTSILLPICGNEEFTDEESDGMLDGLQLLESTKKRESDPKLRLLLLETLLLLSSTLQGREKLRQVKVYPILQKMHLSEKDDLCIDQIEKVVDLIIRDEEPINRIGQVEE